MRSRASLHPYGAEWEMVTMVSMPLALAAAVAARKEGAKPVSEHSSTSNASPPYFDNWPALIIETREARRVLLKAPFSFPPPIDRYFRPTKELYTPSLSANARDGSAQPLKATPKVAPAGALLEDQVQSQYPITVPCGVGAGVGTGDGGVGGGVGVGGDGGAGPELHHSPPEDASQEAWSSDVLHVTNHVAW